MAAAHLVMGRQVIHFLLDGLALGPVLLPASGHTELWVWERKAATWTDSARVPFN